VTSPVNQFVGWGNTDFVPGAYAESLFAQGTISAGSLTKKALMIGLQGTAGTATPNQDINRIYSPADTDGFHGPGSELNVMCVAALSVPGANVYAAPILKATGSPTAGTVTLTWTGTTSAVTGNVVFYIDGTRYSFGVTPSMTLTQIGVAMQAAMAGNPRCPMTAAPTAGVVVLSTVDLGSRTADHSIYLDMTQAPAWLTGTFTGSSSSLTSTNGLTGVRPTAGTGTAELMTTLLTALWPGTWDYIAIAAVDTVSLTAMKTQVEGKAAITEGRLEQFMFAQNGTLAAATSLAQTTLNEYRASCLWMNDGESHNATVVAGMAALRSVTEGANPVAYYDGVAMPWVVPNRFIADVPTHAQQVSALQNSVTPLVTVNGQATIGMLITTYSLFGAGADYRCLQTYYVTMPDYARGDIGLRWISSIKPNNPRVADDVAVGQPQPPAGVWVPKQATAWLVGIAVEYQLKGWFVNVAQNLPVAGFNATARRMESVFPCPVSPGNHQYGNSVRQLGSPYPAPTAQTL